MAWVLPSPKFHVKLYGAVPPEASAVKLARNGAVPAETTAEADTTIAPDLGFTSIATWVETEIPVLSVTVRVAENDPAVVYVWVTRLPLAEAEPSPKDQV